ncbi:hypothetical protein P0C22_06595 [Plesiomonas shigelloides]|nr:hypothetical protein [Plesiomonas shigelloides]
MIKKAQHDQQSDHAELGFRGLSAFADSANAGLANLRGEGFTLRQ